MTRKRLTILGALGSVLLVVLGVGGVWGVNQTVFSPAGTVRTYLDALARGDSASALAMPGVNPEGIAEPRGILLASAAYSGPTDVVVETSRQSFNRATVTATYRLGEDEHRSVFTLSRTETPVFSEWRFDSSPLASLTVSVQHGREFQVGKLGTVDIAAFPGGDVSAFSASATFPVFSGVSYRVFRDRPLVSAKADIVAISDPGSAVAASITLEPTAEFVAQAQEGINTALDLCATQKVLMPTDCPFGFATSNRFVGEPTWSITEYPKVTITPSDASWILGGHATAHISGSVQSLFDGTTSPVEEDTGFTVNTRAYVVEDGRSFVTSP